MRVRELTVQAEPQERVWTRSQPAGSGTKHKVSQDLSILVVRPVGGHSNDICRINIPVASPDWSFSCNRSN